MYFLTFSLHFFLWHKYLYFNLTTECEHYCHPWHSFKVKRPELTWQRCDALQRPVTSDAARHKQTGVWNWATHCWLAVALGAGVPTSMTLLGSPCRGLTGLSLWRRWPTRKQRASHIAEHSEMLVESLTSKASPPEDTGGGTFITELSDR